MKKLILLSILSVNLSCSTKDSKFCDCLTAGEELNNFSSTLFDKEITIEMKDQMERLKNNKRDKCKAYEMMSGENMLELKENCK
jgi:hypothetical protein